MQDSATQSKPLLPTSRQRSSDEILLAFKVGHFERPFYPLLKIAGGYAIKPGKQSDVFDNCQIVIKRKLLRHVANILSHRFRISAYIESRNLSASRCGLEQADIRNLCDRILA